MKAKFLLPGFNPFPMFVNKLELNLCLYDYMNKEENKHKFYNCEIIALFDCFNGITWQSGRDMVEPHFTLLSLLDCRNIIERVNSKGLGLRFVYSNNSLEKKHLNDFYANEITDILAANPLNSIVASMPMLRDYLKSKYPNLTVGLSTTRGLRTSDAINKALEEWDFVTPSYKINHNFTIFEQITHPDRLEVLANELCDINCTNRSKDYENCDKIHTNYGEYRENKEQICEHRNWKNNTILNSIKNNITNLTNHDVYKEYITRNINIFKITDRAITPLMILEAYIYHTVLPEYRFETYIEILHECGLRTRAIIPNIRL